MEKQPHLNDFIETYIGMLSWEMGEISSQKSLSEEHTKILLLLLHFSIMMASFSQTMQLVPSHLLLPSILKASGDETHVSLTICASWH